jgi:hypothetical protein
MEQCSENCVMDVHSVHVRVYFHYLKSLWIDCSSTIKLLGLKVQRFLAELDG